MGAVDLRHGDRRDGTRQHPHADPAGDQHRDEQGEAQTARRNPTDRRGDGKRHHHRPRGQHSLAGAREEAPPDEGDAENEYEGNRWIEDAEEPDSVEQVRRQQVMLASLLGEPAPVETPTPVAA